MLHRPQQFSQFGTIAGVSRLKASDTHSKRSYGFIDYQETIAARRAFASKVFVKGKHVKARSGHVGPTSNVVLLMRLHERASMQQRFSY